MEKPEHLRPAEPRAGSWLAARPAALAAAVLGFVSFVVVAVVHGELGSAPPPAVSLPGLALTAAASVASVARRERAAPLWLAGLAVAAAATVLGYFLLAAGVVVVAVIVMAILHALM